MACNNSLFSGSCCTWIIILLVILVLFGGDLLGCPNSNEYGNGCGCCG
ncbi:MAG: hypothetical protein MJ177_04975 [Clostridia bacterium]|nr:hypothetical protein [Clostridia bacterium]